VPAEAPLPWSQTLRATLAVWPILVLILAVLGSLFLGIATPTESAAVGVAAAALLGFTMGDLTLTRLMQTFVNSARTFAVIAFVFLGAVILAQSISVLQLPQKPRLQPVVEQSSVTPSCCTTTDVLDDRPLTQQSCSHYRFDHKSVQYDDSRHSLCRPLSVTVLAHRAKYARPRHWFAHIG
jgi:hypothetical protein